MHPDDPRRHPKHRERGPKVYGYTVADVAELAGRSVSTVRQSGIDLGSLREVVDYINGRSARRRTK